MSKLSIILLSYQSESKLTNACNAIASSLSDENIPYEIIIVDDGSKDQSYAVAQTLADSDQNIKCIQLAKNYTSPLAQFAGLSVCSGSCAAPMPDDGQRPIGHVIQMYRLWERGVKVIIGFRQSRNDGWWSDLASSIYYRLMNGFSDITFPKGGSDGYLIDRDIIDLLNKSSQHNTTPTIELLYLGYDPVYMGYDRPAPIGKSRWTIRKRLHLAMTTFFASSHLPLRLITYLGLSTMGISIVLIASIVISKIFSDNTLFGLPIQGWATLVVLIALFNGLILFCIGIVAEYLWRMYEEVKGRPPFIIRNKKL